MLCLCAEAEPAVASVLQLANHPVRATGADRVLDLTRMLTRDTILPKKVKQSTELIVASFFRNGKIITCKSS